MRLCLFVRQRRCFVLCRLPPAGLSILHRLRGCIWPMQGCCTGRRAGTQLFRKTAFLHLAFRGLPSPGPRGYFALGGKVTKTPPETPRTPFSLIGRLQGRNPVATEFPRGLRLPRNRCGGHLTSPVGPRDEGIRASPIQTDLHSFFGGASIRPAGESPPGRRPRTRRNSWRSIR